MVSHVPTSGDIKYNHSVKWNCFDKDILFCYELLILDEKINLFLAMVGNVP